MPHSQLDLFNPFIVHPPAGRKTSSRGGARATQRNELLEMMRLAMVVCRRHLNDYSCPKSKHTFTQPQLLACLILKTCKKLTYRGTVEVLELSDGLRDVLGMQATPAHTTLLEFSKRVLNPVLLDELIGQVLALLQERGLVVHEVAIDSTGVETSSASAHFIARSKRQRRGYVKLSLAVACTTLMLVAAAVSVGPSNDLGEARDLLWRSSARARPDWLLADRGYDAEWVHTFSGAWGAKSYIPPVPKTKDGSIKSGPGRIRSGKHRPYLAGWRWNAESFISGMKRTCGSTLSARTEPALLTEAALKALAYAIRR